MATSSPWVSALVRQLELTPKLAHRNEAILARYVWDMERAIGQVSRVLKRGGRAVYVVGDSTVRGTFIENSRIVATIAKAKGLQLSSKVARDLPASRRYLPPPKAGGLSPAMDARMRHEVVMEFTKPG